MTDRHRAQAGLATEESTRRVLNAAIASLCDRGVWFALRKAYDFSRPLPRGGELDIFLARRDRRAADDALARVGFRKFDARGYGRHRFYLGSAGGRWVKIDAKLGPGSADSAPWTVSHGRAAPEAMSRLAAAVARRLPLAPRRSGPVVALLGPDGAGKGSVVARLESQIPVGVTTLYLGTRQTRLRLQSAGPTHRVSAPRECLGVTRKFARALATLARGYAAAWSGRIVLCDRHPIEVLAIRPERSRSAAMLERLLATRLTPWPDLVVVLDAPGQVLLERKPEHSVETLERWRAAYRSFFGARGATVVSTLKPLDDTVDEVAAALWLALCERRQWPIAGP